MRAQQVVSMIVGAVYEAVMSVWALLWRKPLPGSLEARGSFRSTVNLAVERLERERDFRRICRSEAVAKWDLVW